MPKVQNIYIVMYILEEKCIFNCCIAVPRMATQLRTERGHRGGGDDENLNEPVVTTGIILRIVPIIRK